MADSNQIEQAVARTLRDSLGRIQGASEELSQAINDLVSACASSRPSNALPSMVRAQSSAASLSAALEVLSRFVTTALQPASRSPLEQEIALSTAQASAGFLSPVERPAMEQPAGGPLHLTTQTASISEEIHLEPGNNLPHDPGIAAPDFAADVQEEAPVEPMPAVAMPPESQFEGAEEMPASPEMPAMEPVYFREPEPLVAPGTAPAESPAFGESAPEMAAPQWPEPQVAAPAESVPGEPVSVPVTVAEPAQPPQPVFDVAKLPEEERELHKRAYRVAKVSMQDIVMLHPEDIRLGRENKDLCFRLRDDIEKAHREYGRRFQSIYNHPVDYFYDWMVEILAAGNAEALGEYPYPSPVVRR